jgi:membrane-bound lytic murein transglycosylase D
MLDKLNCFCCVGSYRGLRGVFCSVLRIESGESNIFMIRRLSIASLLLLALPLMAETLPRPAGLEPDIGFWRSVFTEINTNQAFVHDNRNLGVIYETVEIPKRASSGKRRNISATTRKKYQRILTALASGKRQGLTSDQKRVLGLWPDDVTNAELRRAAGRVRFQQGLSDRFLEGFIRSGQWRDHILTSLKNAGVPTVLVSLPHVESSYNPIARSFVGAAGLWQFTRSTGRRFMQIDHVVDERRDPFLSSVAAASLLQYNYSILKSWPLAITAYNHGVAGMRRAVKKLGTDDIEVILRKYDGRTFGFASRNFYVAFLAANEVDQNVEKYFGPATMHRPRPENVVILPDYMAVDTLENAFGVSTATLKQYNPALLSPVWSGTKHVPRGYELRLPDAGQGSEPKVILAGISADLRFAAQTPDLHHKVERGESLSVIAARYGTSVSELVAMNGLRSRNRIRAGQVLNLPYSGPASTASIPTDTDTYIVQPGDTLGTIASRAGIDERDLLALNSLPNRNRIYPGQKLALVADKAATPRLEVTDTVVDKKETAEVFADLPVAVPSADALAAGATEVRAEPSTAAVVVAAVTEDQAESVTAAFVADPAAADQADTSMALGVADSVAVDQAEPSMALVVGDPVTDGREKSAQQDAEQSADLIVDQGAASPLLADPSDYLVSSDGTIEVQAAETLGHYSDWLELRTQELRDLNGYSFRQPLVIGHRVQLKFADVDADQFAARRIAFHREIQEEFFLRYRIKDTTIHQMRRGESLFVLTLRRYKIPIWLLRQYNPDLDLDLVQPGAKIVFPQIELAGSVEASSPTLADSS